MYFKSSIKMFLHDFAKIIDNIFKTNGSSLFISVNVCFL